MTPSKHKLTVEAKAAMVANLQLEREDNPYYYSRLVHC